MFKVKIEKGFWMCGTHSFMTKRAACEFIAKWVSINGRSDAISMIGRKHAF